MVNEERWIKIKISSRMKQFSSRYLHPTWKYGLGLDNIYIQLIFLPDVFRPWQIFEMSSPMILKGLIYFQILFPSQSCGQRYDMNK